MCLAIWFWVLSHSSLEYGFVSETIIPITGTLILHCKKVLLYAISVPYIFLGAWLQGSVLPIALWLLHYPWPPQPFFECWNLKFLFCALLCPLNSHYYTVWNPVSPHSPYFSLLKWGFHLYFCKQSFNTLWLYFLFPSPFSPSHATPSPLTAFSLISISLFLFC